MPSAVPDKHLFNGSSGICVGIVKIIITVTLTRRGKRIVFYHWFYWASFFKMFMNSGLKLPTQKPEEPFL